MGDARRQRILERDDYCCRHCGLGRWPFEIDHEIGLFFHDIDPERWPLAILEADSNLRALCVECHKQHTSAQAAIRRKLRRLRKENKKRVRRPIPSRPFRRQVNARWPRKQSRSTKSNAE